jgi:hypothetical protein
MSKEHPRRPMKVVISPKGHHYSDNACYETAILNNRSCYNNKLNVVLGSLGIGIGNKPFWEFGFEVDKNNFEDYVNDN